MAHTHVASPERGFAGRCLAHERKGRHAPRGRRADQSRDQQRPRDPTETQRRAAAEVRQKRRSDGATGQSGGITRRAASIVPARRRAREIPGDHRHTGRGAAHAPGRRAASGQDSRRGEWSGSGNGMYGDARRLGIQIAEVLEDGSAWKTSGGVRRRREETKARGDVANSGSASGGSTVDSAHA